MKSPPDNTIKSIDRDHGNFETSDSGEDILQKVLEKAPGITQSYFYSGAGYAGGHYEDMYVHSVNVMLKVIFIGNMHTEKARIMKTATRISSKTWIFAPAG